MWSLIFFIGTCSALSVKEHWRYISDDGIELRRGIYGIHIKRNTLWSIAPMAIASAPDRIIDLSNLNIKVLRINVFDHLANVTVLNLTNNRLMNIPPLILVKLKTLETLSLANNKLRTFDRSFIGLRNLKSLDLSNNLIESLTAEDLFGLPKAVNLTIAGNHLKTLTINVDSSSLPYYVPSKWNKNPWTKLNMSDLESVVKMWEDLTNVPVHSSFARAWSSYNSWRFYLKLCKSNDGVVESVKVAEEEEALGGCQMITPLGLSLILNLKDLGIKQFQPKWYRITKSLFETLDLSSNKIIDISPVLLENLPASIISVDLEHNSISRIERSSIQNKLLKKISFVSNRIEIIEDGAFAGTNLVSISFAYNNLKDNLNFVKTLPMSIQELILNGNGISKVPEDFVTNLTDLRYLEIAENKIYHLSANTFRGLKKLQKIDLSRNSLEAIEPGTFKDQQELLNLELYTNRIKELTPGIFNGLKKIRWIGLEDNEIMRINRNSFSGLQSLVMHRLDLSENAIGTIEEGSFSYMTIYQLYLNYNNISEKSVEKEAFEFCTLYELIYDSNPLKNISGDRFDGLLLYKENRFFF